jgi:ankyrin repeat protein
MPHEFGTIRITITLLTLSLVGLLTSCHRDPPVSLQWRLGKELRSAAGFGTREDVLRLLQQGADINAKDNSGQTPLTLACTMYSAYIQFKIEDPPGGLAERKAVIKLLIDRGANPNVVGERAVTPLMNAAASGDEEIVNSLLHAGARATVTQMDVDGRTARDYALAQGHTVIADLIER